MGLARWWPSATPVSRPPVQLLEDAFYFRKSEVVQPAPKFRGYLFDGCFEVSALSPSEDRPEIGFELVNRLPGYAEP